MRRLRRRAREAFATTFTVFLVFSVLAALWGLLLDRWIGPPAPGHGGAYLAEALLDAWHRAGPSMLFAIGLFGLTSWLLAPWLRTALCLALREPRSVGGALREGLGRWRRGLGLELLLGLTLLLGLLPLAPLPWLAHLVWKSPNDKLHDHWIMLALVPALLWAWIWASGADLSRAALAQGESVRACLRAGRHALDRRSLLTYLGFWIAGSALGAIGLLGAALPTPLGLVAMQALVLARAHTRAHWLAYAIARIAPDANAAGGHESSLRP